MDKKSELLIKKFLPMKNLLLSLAAILTFCCFNTVNAQDCVDTNIVDGVVTADSYGDGCADYITAWCGGYDTATFDSNAMCCICGGGEISMPEDPGCSDGETLLTMMDSYGDGWNGNALVVNGTSYTFDSGSQATACVALLDCNVIEWTTGGYVGETSWMMGDLSGAAGSGTGAFGNCGVPGCMAVDACNYNIDATTDDGSCTFAAAGLDCDGNCLSGSLLTMTDSYGDGWNGASLSINGVSYTVASGSGAVACVDLLDCNTISWTAGAWDAETSWSIAGTELSGAAGSGTGDFGDCPVYGCTDSSACNYNSEADTDDASCTFASEGFDCDGNIICDAATQVAADLTISGSDGSAITVIVDGEAVVENISADGTISACISAGVLAGSSCVEISVVAGSDPANMSWFISAYNGAAVLAAGDGNFGSGQLGCDIAGCMDETACNYNSEATVSGDCTYPDANADCEGNFVCNDLLFTLDMYDLSGDADGWNGNTFQVIDWVTGEVVPGAGPFTFDDGEMGTALACFPEDMATGCYVIEIGGGDNEAQVGWHLYGYEVFGNYVVDWSAGMAQEWSSAGGELLFGDSGTYQDENGDFISLGTGEFIEGYPDWNSGVGTYDTNNDGVADGYDIGYGCPCLNDSALNYVFDMDPADYASWNDLGTPYGEVIPDGTYTNEQGTEVAYQDQSDPCDYGAPDVIGCMDQFAANYNMEANVACDDCCELPACVGSGMDMDETVAGLVYGASQGQVTVNGCYDGLPTLLGLLGVTCDTDMSLFTDQLPAGTTAQMLCGCSCPDPVVTTCMDDAACNYEAVGECTYADEGFDCAGDPLVCDGSGTNDNASVAAQFYGFGCEGAIATMMGSYGYTEDEACAFDGMVPNIDETTGEFLGMIMMFDLGGQTLGDFCGCSCADPVPAGMLVEWASTDSWPTENGFSITDCDGNVLASMEAGAGFDQAVDLPDNYILTLTDSYGDGGGQVTIGDTVYTLDGGSSESFVVGVCAISGCTDAAACNYDSTANEDDGSCTFAAEGFDCDGNQLDCTGDVTANLSWVGDGYCDDGAFGQYLDCETFNYDDGDCGHCVDPLASNYGVIAECEYAPTGTQVTWASTDSWPTENGFSITDCDGNVLASMEAGAGFDQAVDLPDNYILTLTDSYGDGGGQVTIGDTVYTLDGGSSESWTIGECAEDPGTDCTNYQIQVGGGSWASEVSWNITDENDAIVASGVAAPSTACLDLSNCYTINMFDSYGDGWNGNTLTVAGETFGLPAGSSGTASLGTCTVVCDFTEVAISVQDGEGTDFGFSITDSSGATVIMGGNSFDGVGCFDFENNCYNVSLSSSGGNGPLDATLTVGDQVYSWGDSLGSYSSVYDETLGDACPVYGCTDATACNYDSGADTDDGSCEFLSCTCDGSVLTVTGGGYPTEVSWSITDCDGGILFEGGANYSECVDLPDNYIIDMVDSFGDGWNGAVLSIGDESYTIDTGSANAVGIGCFVEVLGCIDEVACNYDASANTDDGSCYYPEVGYNCDFEFLGCPEGTDSYVLNAYDSGNDGWGNIAMNVYFDGELQLFEAAIAIFGDDVTSFPFPGIDHTYSLGLQFEADCAPDPFNGFQYVQCAEQNAVICVDPSVECFTFDVFTIENYGGGFVGQDSDPAEVSWTWEGPNGDILASGAGTNMSTSAGSCGGIDIVGCMDSTACNYNADATVDNGTCIMPNVCGSCDGDESCFGCMDDTACNFDSSAIEDDGSCEYPVSGYDCEGNFTCDFELTTVSYDGTGSWQTENAWVITDASGNVVWSGFGSSTNFATADLCMDPNGCYTFSLTDSYGDGWNGNSLDAGSFGTYTINGGAAFEASNCVAECTDEEVATYWMNNDGMSGFAISNSEGVVASGGSDFNGVACLDFSSCYSVNLVPSAGGLGAGAALVVGDQTFAYEDGTNAFFSSDFINAIGSGCPAMGCMDETACNYDADAEEDDFSCTYPNACGSCEGDESCLGCLDSTACNYNAEATVDDGSCDFISCACEGTIITCDGGSWQGEVSWSISDADGNIVASGGAPYNQCDVALDPNACYTITMNDSYGDGWNGNVLSIDGTAFTLAAGSAGTDSYGNCVFECDYTELSVSVSGGEGTDFGFAITDSNGETVVMGGSTYEGVGCFDLDNNCYDVSLSSSGGNGDQGATLTIGEQEFTWGDGLSFSSVYEQAVGTCVPEVLGCMDATACNYDDAANIDDGSCYYADDCEADYCFEESFDNVTWNGGNWGTWSGTDADAATVADGVMTLDFGDDVVSTLPTFNTGVFEVSFDLNILTSGYFNFGNSGNTLAWDWENQFYFSADGTASDDFGNTWTFAPGLPMDVSTFIDLDNGAAVLVIDGNWVAEWAWTGALGGVNFFPDADGSQFTVDNFSMCEGEMPVMDMSGCTDAAACNYDSSATEDDGSCTYADECNSCDGPIDTDGDGVADCDEVAGCTDMMACNYNPNATDDDESCEYTDGVYDCDGITCLADSDGDGICDPNEVSGCTDSMASNFNSSATDDDGSCEYLSGCMDPAAGNYDSTAQVDDGSCEYGPWNVVSTDCNMTVLVQADANITVEGEPATGELWVGAFTENGTPAGQVLVTPGVVTSIALWGAEAGEDNGFQAGEEITWAVYYNGEEIPATVGWSFGESTYSCNGLSGVNVIAATSIYTQEIALAQGWNIWSTYISPENYNMASVFDAIVDDVVIVKDENGLVFWPAFGLNNIGNLADGEGYQTKMDAATTLSLEGTLVPYDMEMSLDNGWNIMGYLHQDPMDAADALNSIVESIVIVKDENGLVFWPAFGLNNIGNMMAGEGYQIKTEGGAMFSYPSMMGSRLGYANPVRTVHFDRPSNTGSNMVIGLPSYAWDNAPSVGDEIAVYDEIGNLVGSTTYEGGHVAITVWGDDLTTDQKEGLVEGEDLIFKLWHADIDVEETFVVRWEEGTGSYITDGISVAGNISLEGISDMNSYELYQNVPNPFNGKTSIGFFAPVDGEVNITVYNMLGELVEVVTNDMYSAGEHTVTFKSNELGQGTYFVKMTTADWSATRSMNLVK